MTTKLRTYLTEGEVTKIREVFELYWSVGKAIDQANYILQSKGSTYHVTYRPMRVFLQEVSPSSWKAYEDKQKAAAEAKINAQVQRDKKAQEYVDKTSEDKKPVLEGPYPPFLNPDTGYLWDGDRPNKKKSMMKRLEDMEEKRRTKETIRVPEEGHC